MIEEAAGTRMYENKRTSAQKTIEKKDAKLKEIESVSTAALSLNSFANIFRFRTYSLSSIVYLKLFGQ